MRIGVTGSDGFIGGHLVASLREKHDVVRFKRDSSGIFSGLEPSVLSSCEAIICLAGVNRGTDEQILHGNVIPLFSLLRRLAIEDLHTVLVFASTLQVYGFSAASVARSESDLAFPCNTYGLSKLLAEHLLSLSSRKEAIKAVILRIANVYGPGCKSDYNSAVATFENRVRNGMSLCINGSGIQERDFVFVDDVVESFSAAIEYSRNMPQSLALFNICSGVPVSLNTLASLVAKVHGGRVRIEHVPTDRPPDFLIGNPERAAREMGFRAKIDLEPGLKKTMGFPKGGVL